MTRRERQQRKAALKSSIRSGRARMTAALAAMDYETALVCQVEIDDLQRAHAAEGPTRRMVNPILSAYNVLVE